MHEKMSMLIVPVSGQVCSTPCDSRRISTQVSPVFGNACVTASTTVAPARSSARMKSSATSSAVKWASASQPERSAENEAGEAVASMPGEYSQPPAS